VLKYTQFKASKSKLAKSQSEDVMLEYETIDFAGSKAVLPIEVVPLSGELSSSLKFDRRLCGRRRLGGQNRVEN